MEARVDSLFENSVICGTEKFQATQSRWPGGSKPHVHPQINTQQNEVHTLGGILMAI